MDPLGELAADLFEQHVLLPVIDFLDRIEDPRGHTDLQGFLGQRAHVFREATAAVADTGEEECETDAVIVADTVADFVDVRPDSLADVRHLVDEADFRGEHRVRHIFGQLSAFRRHGEKWPASAEQRRIQRSKRLRHRRPTHADDDPIGIHEVVDRRPFLQELGVARDIAIAAGELLKPRVGRRVGSHRNGAFQDDDRVRRQVGRQAVDDLPDERQVGAAIGGGRRAHGDEDQLRFGDRVG